MAIYDTYYGCRLEPFSLNPDPRFLYMTPRHREALAQLRYVTMERRGFVVLTGEVGTGKTTLLRKYLEDAVPEVTTGYVFNPPRSLSELQDCVSRELGLAWREPEPFLGCLNEFLLDSMGHDKVVVLVFDEAQALPLNVLEEIRLLSNLETSSAKLLQIVLAGQPEFNTMLESVELRALRQRVALRCALEPMRPEESVEYIGNRLRIAGARRSPFTLEACALIHRYSAGIPRLINSLCDASMMIGYASDSPVIGDSLVNKAAADLGLKASAPVVAGSDKARAKKGNRWFGRLAGYSVGSIVVAAALLWFMAGVVGPSLNAQPEALLHRAYSYVTRMVDSWSNEGGRARAGASQIESGRRANNAGAQHGQPRIADRRSE